MRLVRRGRLLSAGGDARTSRLVGKTATEIRTLHFALDREYRRRGY
jgi:hypothetical protein